MAAKEKPQRHSRGKAEVLEERRRIAAIDRELQDDIAHSERRERNHERRPLALKVRAAKQADGADSREVPPVRHKSRGSSANDKECDGPQTRSEHGRARRRPQPFRKRSNFIWINRVCIRLCVHRLILQCSTYYIGGMAAAVATSKVRPLGTRSI